MNIIEPFTTSEAMPPQGKVYVYGPRDKLPENCITFNVTSKSTEEWTRKFSPFFLGPVEVQPYDQPIQCRIMENAWQYCKIYQDMTKEDHIKWSRNGFNAMSANRFPMGKGVKPLGSMWHGELLDYIDARLHIYIPLYMECIEKYAYQELKRLRDLVMEGKDIALFDFDGYNYIEKNMTLQDVIYNPHKVMGHAFVLAMMITF